MTAPRPDSTDTTTGPSQALATELLTTTTLPATTASTATTSPKLPPFRGD
jgi:hypothetical protein